jgi:phage gpG-like protein
MAYPDVKVEIKGIQEVNAALRAYGKDLGRGLELIINAAAVEAVTDVRKAIEGPPKTGVIYYRGKNRDIKHQASKEGEAPATDTGALVISIYNEDRGKYAKAIGSRLDYAYYLEFGTFKMKPRKSWLPAVERAIPKMLKRVQIAIAKAKARAEKTTK